MSYPSMAPSRRSYDSRRRRRRMVLLVFLAVVVGLVALAVRYRTEERRTVDYLAVAIEVAQTEAGLADSLAEMLSNLGGLERQDLLERIDSLGAQVSADVQTLAAQDVPAAVAEAHGFLTVALAAWQDALTSLDDVVLQILDSEEENPGGEAGLTAVFEHLRVGDRAYLGFLEARSRVEIDEASGSIAEVRYVAVGSESLFNGETIARRLSATRRLGGRRDVSVTARTVPDALGTQNGRPVVPSSESFAVLAVVTNEGNMAEEGISVTLELALSSGDESPITRQQLILSLDPGQATTIEFSDLILVPGELYDLQITVSITEDADPFNNIYELVFFRNQDA